MRQVSERIGILSEVVRGFQDEMRKRVCNKVRMSHVRTGSEVV